LLSEITPRQVIEKSSNACDLRGMSNLAATGTFRECLLMLPSKLHRLQRGQLTDASSGFCQIVWKEIME